MTAVHVLIAAGARTATAPCAEGETVIGGGVTQTDTKKLLQSGPSGTLGWLVTFDANMGAGKSATVTVYCAH